MKSFYLKDNGDLMINKLNEIEMIDKESEVRQRNKITLKTAKGEWFLNINFGVDWNNLLGDKDISNEDIKQAILNELEKDDAIEKVNNIELDFDNMNRTLDIYIYGKLTDKNKFKMEVNV